jgi:hypothetical protein
MGKYNVRFDASGLSSGLYFYLLEHNNKIKINKMLLIK